MAEHNLHVGDTAPQLQFTINEDLTNADNVEIRYRKPDSNENYFPGTITDVTVGTVVYQLSSSGDLDDTGIWNFWIHADFNDGTSKDYNPVIINVYEPGKLYICYPYGTTSSEEGDYSMPTEAFRVVYNNTISGLTADDVQDALDEINNNLETLTASEVAYVNTTSGLTADKVQTAIDEIYSAYGHNKRYTVGTSPGDYTSIQDAINAAVADGHTTSSNQAVVVVKPGTYTEITNELTLEPFVNLSSVLIGDTSSVVFSGKVIVNFSNDGEYTSITGLTLNSQMLENALEFSGIHIQTLYMNSCNISSIASGLSAVLMDNTGVGSKIVADKVNLIGNATSTECTLKSSNGIFSLKNGSVSSVNVIGSVQLSGSAKLEIKRSATIGQLFCVDTSLIEAAICSMSSGVVPLLTTNSTGVSVFYGVYANSNSPTFIADGTGGFVYGLITYNNSSTGRGFDSTLNSGSGALLLEVESTPFRTGIVDPTHSPANAGEPYYRTDTHEFFLWDGAAWHKITLA